MCIMNIEEVLELFENDTPSIHFEGDETLEGLNILAKYTKGSVLCGAEHDKIYSVDIEEVLEAGITDEELIRLRGLGFMIDDCSYFSSFV